MIEFIYFFKDGYPLVHSLFTYKKENMCVCVSFHGGLTKACRS